MKQNKLQHLTHLKEQEAFIVPDEYFEEFALKMQHTIAGQSEKKKSPFYELLEALRLRFTLPATLAITIAIIALQLSESKSVVIDSVDVQAYLLNESSFMENDQFYEIVLPEIDESKHSTKETEVVLDYLIDSEEIDLSEIETLIN